MDLKNLIVEAAASTGLSTTQINLMYGNLGASEGGFMWTAVLTVFTGKPRRPHLPAPHRTFTGHDPNDPAKALTEAISEMARSR